MMERFYKLRNCIKKALVDVFPAITLEEWEIERISDIVEALKPIQAIVEALCKRDGNLITADAAFNFTLRKLKEQNSALSLELHEALKIRIGQRRTILSDILQYLHKGEYLSDNDEEDEVSNPVTFTKIATSLKDLIIRLETSNEPSKSIQNLASTELTEVSKLQSSKTESHKELDLALTKALSSNHIEKTQPTKSFLSTIKQEMKLFEAGGKRGIHLSVAYDLLMGIVPTSVESERAFSSSGYLCNKIRSSYKDETLDHLCYLRFYFQNE